MSDAVNNMLYGKILLTRDELFEAEHKLANSLRVSLYINRHITEVYTGTRYVSVTDYVLALIEKVEQDERYEHLND